MANHAESYIFRSGKTSSSMAQIPGSKEPVQPSSLFYSFITIFLADLIIVAAKADEYRYVSKSLLMLALLAYFLRQTRRLSSSLKNWIVLALVFSWGGDVLLMFEPMDQLFFMLGLGSFLIAHIFYIIFFHRVRIAEAVVAKPLLLLIVVLYYLALMWLLSPYLGELKLPVRIYGVVISFMLMLAMHVFFISNKRSARNMLAGAVLFVVSDSVLAINKFYSSFFPADLIIMTTYGLAQLLLVIGAMDYMRGKQ